MKEQKKNRRGLNLQTENKRWKWMASATAATAATAAGVTASQASTITVNLLNNYISDGNHLNADLTGDGHPDLTIANALNYSSRRYTFYGRLRVDASAAVVLNGVQARAHFFYSNFGYADLTLGSQTAFFAFPGSRSSLTGSIPIFFKDLHINGGAPTEGSLEVAVSPFVVQLDSFTYNDPSFHAANGTAVPDQGSSAVPDQGSSLALLAMGAGGILALRRWRAAQGRS